MSKTQPPAGCFCFFQFRNKGKRGQNGSGTVVQARASANGNEARSTSPSSKKEGPAINTEVITADVASSAVTSNALAVPAAPAPGPSPSTDPLSAVAITVAASTPSPSKPTPEAPTESAADSSRDASAAVGPSLFANPVTPAASPSPPSTIPEPTPSQPALNHHHYNYLNRQEAAEEGPGPQADQSAGLSVSSAVSTAYYSAGGWSQFDDNGEWIGSNLDSNASGDVPAGPHALQPITGAVHLTASAIGPHRTSDPGPLPPAPGATGLQVDTSAALVEPQGSGGPEPGVPAGLLPAGDQPGPHPQLHQHPPGGPHPPHRHYHPHLHPQQQQHHQYLQHKQAAGSLPALPEREAEARDDADPTTSPTGTETAQAEYGIPASAPAPFPAAAPAAAGSSSEGPGLEAVLDEVVDLYGARSMPCKACQLMISYCKARGVQPDSLAPELQARQLPDASTLIKVAKSIYDSLADLASDEGWHVVRNDDLRLCYKHLQGPGLHCFRARCILDAPTEHLVALTREIDLCPTWNKYCTSAKVLKQMSLSDIVVFMSLWVPWPFNGVAFTLEANAADLYDEEGCLHVAFSTPRKQVIAGMELPPGAEKLRPVRLLPPSCVSFTPLPPHSPGGPSRTMVRIQGYVDPGTRLVPSFIISFVLKVLSPFVYNVAKKTLASAFKLPDNPLPARIRQCPELYELVRKRSDAYLAARPPSDPAPVPPSPSKKAGLWRSRI